MKPYGFWISPLGEIVTIMTDFNHRKIIEEILGKTFESDVDATEKTLEQGWIRIVNGNNSLMVDYRYIQTKHQLKVLSELNDKLETDGYFHKDFILSYGYDYWCFNSFKELLNHIKSRSC